jgi:Fic family protein
MNSSQKSHPTRYISSFIIEFISDFICFCNENYQMSADDIAIISLIASESTREIRNDVFLTKNYGNEDDAFPSLHRPPTSAKTIYTRLGMKRETTRRKLESLADRQMITKVKGGYVFPAQIGLDDYTKDLREFFIKKLSSLDEYRRKMPE